jgi:hypothetical protein
MKRVAKGKPIVRIVEVLNIVQVRLAVRVVPPDIAGLGVAVERDVENTFCITAPR